MHVLSRTPLCTIALVPRPRRRHPYNHPCTAVHNATFHDLHSIEIASASNQRLAHPGAADTGSWTEARRIKSGDLHDLTAQHHRSKTRAEQTQVELGLALKHNQWLVGLKDSRKTHF